MRVVAEWRRLECGSDGDPDDRKRRAYGADVPPAWPRRGPGPSARSPTRSTARPCTPADQVVQTDALPDLEVEEVCEAALDHHAAGSHPTAGSELRLVDGHGGGVPPLGHHRVRVPADHEVRHGD